MINPNELEEPVPPLSHLLFDEVTALRQEIVQIRDQRDNADTVQAFQIAAAKQALQDVTEAVAEMEIEIARLRAELKTSNAERDEARLGLLQESGEDMSANQPICKTCGVLWVDHMGIQGTCAENAKLRKERDELRQQVENIKNGFEGGCYLCEVVGEMNKKLLKERDEARIWWLKGYYQDWKSEAKSRGWDSFDIKKEGTA
jgi:cell division protein FtsB